MAIFVSQSVAKSQIHKIFKSQNLTDFLRFRLIFFSCEVNLYLWKHTQSFKVKQQPPLGITSIRNPGTNRVKNTKWICKYYGKPSNIWMFWTFFVTWFLANQKLVQNWDFTVKIVLLTLPVRGFRFCGCEGGAKSAPPPKKSMKELCQTPGCYIEVWPI